MTTDNLDHAALLRHAAVLLRAIYLSRRQLFQQATDPTMPVSSGLHPRWDGGQDARGVNHRGVWADLAQFGMDHNLDPVNWVDTLFALNYLFTHQPPWPSDLTSPRVLDRLRTTRDTVADGVVCGSRSEILLLRRELFFRTAYAALSRASVVRTLAADPTIDVSHLARYMFARQEGAHDLAGELYNKAVLQYLGCPEAYDSVYGAATEALKASPGGTGFQTTGGADGGEVEA